MCKLGTVFVLKLLRVMTIFFNVNSPPPSLNYDIRFRVNHIGLFYHSYLGFIHKVARM